MRSGYPPVMKDNEQYYIISDGNALYSMLYASLLFVI